MYVNVSDSMCVYARIIHVCVCVFSCIDVRERLTTENKNCVSKGRRPICCSCICCVSVDFADRIYPVIAPGVFEVGLLKIGAERNYPTSERVINENRDRAESQAEGA